MLKPKLSKSNWLNFGVTLLLLGTLTTPASSIETQQTSNTRARTRNTQTVKPGTYCFKYQTKVTTAEAQLTVNRNNRVTGGIQTVVQDEQEGYYTSADTYFVGNLKSNQLRVNSITKIEYDTQERQETWTLTPNSLKAGRETYTKIACSSLSDRTFNRISRIKFAPGKNSAVLQNSLVRGSQDIYIINGKAGKTMKVSITSRENNAVFNLINPKYEPIQSEITSKTLKLPLTGDYQVVVSGTRGNANYRLRVEIK